MNYQKVELYLLYVLALVNLLVLIVIGLTVNRQIVLSDPPDLLSRAGLQMGMIASLWIADLAIFLVCLLIRMFKL